MKDPNGPVAAPAAEEPRVRLYVGTSEDSMRFFFDGAAETRYLTARQRVRGAAERYMGAGNVPDEKISDLINFYPIINWRAHEISPMFYTSRNEAISADYALTLSSKGGGEFTNHVRALLHLPIVKEDVRPVLLALDVPQSAIAHDGEHETLVRKGAGVKVASVVVGAKREGLNDYIFYDQPALSPEEALAQLRPASRAPAAMPPPDPRQQDILRTIDTFSRDPGVRIGKYAGGYACETTVKDSAGTETTLRVPDITFMPEAPQLLSCAGLRPVYAGYQAPHDFTRIEVNAYLDVLDVREKNGRLAPAAKAEALGALLDDYAAVNPGLRTLEVDRGNPAQMTKVLRGIVNDYGPADLQFDITGRRDAAYDALRRKIIKDLQTSVSLAPQTLLDIENQAAHMPDYAAKKFREAQESWTAPAAKPAVPEPDTYGRDAPALAPAPAASAENFATGTSSPSNAGTPDRAGGHVKSAITPGSGTALSSPATPRPKAL